jgi:predicted ATPase/transcriptional regulator with XRE-family HTH domain
VAKKDQTEKEVISRTQLKYERERRGWTLAYVAEQIDCPDPHMLGRWERGTTSPSPRYRQALCELFGKDAEELGLLPKKPGPLPEQALDQPVPEPSVTRHYSSQPSAHENATVEDRFFHSAQLTSFVGRKQEITTVCELLRRPEVRLLTLTGTGGVGKTRLGVQIVTHLANDFTAGVHILSLMETSDPDQVVPTIAHKLGLQEIGNQPIFDVLKAFLNEKHLLLLLDNFEQVVDAAPILPDLLICCPRLKILVTSRTVLRVSGEYEFSVPPLALPDLTQLPKKEQLAHYPAIALFLERTRAVLPNFTLNETNARVIADICTHLDGLPLAIELAVPRLKLLSPQTLLARLDHRLQLLTNGVQDAPARQQTLRSTLEWSYRLLNPREQQLFCYLSLFVGGCTLEAIETIWATLEDQQEKEWVLEGVASLLDKSMLLRSVEEGKEPRLLMLRTIREYGMEHLSLDGKLEQMQWAHARYYLALAEEAEPALKGPQTLPWLECLEREHDNLREAFYHLITYGENGISMGTELALRLGKALERFWIIRGHVKEGRDLLERALEHSLGVSLSIQGNAMNTLMALVSLQGDLDYMKMASTKNLELFRELGDTVGITRSLCRLGVAAQIQGEYATARTYYEESLAIARREQCLETLNETLIYFSAMTFYQGDINTARTLSEECLTLSRELGDQYNIASTLTILGWVLLLQNNAQAARTVEEENLFICRMLRNQHGIAHALNALGEIAFLSGDLTQAFAYFEESLAIMMQLGDRWIVAFGLERLAGVVAAQGDPIWAVHLLSVAAVLRDVIAASIAPLEQFAREQTLATIENQLNEQAFATAWAEGQTMSPAQVIAARRPFMGNINLIM